MDDKLRHNIVKVAVEPRAAGESFRSKLWQRYDEICHRQEDRRIKNLRQFVFYNNKTLKWSNAGNKWREKTP